MRVGIRTPSIKKSIKARTTGKVKRAVKKSVNPLYGKKGYGFAKDPKRSFNNAIYHRTTVGLSDVVGSSTKSKTKTSSEQPTTVTESSDGKKLLKIGAWFFLIIGIVLCLCSVPHASIAIIVGVVFAIIAMGMK